LSARLRPKVAHAQHTTESNSQQTIPSTPTQPSPQDTQPQKDAHAQTQEPTSINIADDTQKTQETPDSVSEINPQPEQTIQETSLQQNIQSSTQSTPSATKTPPKTWATLFASTAPKPVPKRVSVSTQATNTHPDFVNNYAKKAEQNLEQSQTQSLYGT
jgi:hypothetical protein